jgi:hypothetical protein
MTEIETPKSAAIRLRGVRLVCRHRRSRAENRATSGTRMRSDTNPILLSPFTMTPLLADLMPDRKQKEALRLLLGGILEVPPS